MRKAAVALVTLSAVLAAPSGFRRDGNGGSPIPVPGQSDSVTPPDHPAGTRTRVGLTTRQQPPPHSGLATEQPPLQPPASGAIQSGPPSKGDDTPPGYEKPAPGPAAGSAPGSAPAPGPEHAPAPGSEHAPAPGSEHAPSPGPGPEHAPAPGSAPGSGSEHTPNAEKPAPAPEKPAPAPEKPAPGPEKPAPGSENSAPAPGPENPAPAQGKPAPTPEHAPGPAPAPAPEPVPILQDKPAYPRVPGGTMNDADAAAIVAQVQREIQNAGIIQNQY